MAFENIGKECDAKIDQIFDEICDFLRKRAQLLAQREQIKNHNKNLTPLLESKKYDAFVKDENGEYKAVTLENIKDGDDIKFEIDGPDGKETISLEDAKVFKDLESGQMVFSDALEKDLLTTVSQADIEKAKEEIKEMKAPGTVTIAQALVLDEICGDQLSFFDMVNGDQLEITEDVWHQISLDEYENEIGVNAIEPIKLDGIETEEVGLEVSINDISLHEMDGISNDEIGQEIYDGQLTLDGLNDNEITIGEFDGAEIESEELDLAI